MAYKDYYKILGVGKEATPKDIKAAYRKLARQYHPDVNREDAQAESRFKEVAEAYEVLSDPGKRRSYDNLGKFGWRPRAGGGRVDFSEADLDFSEFFRSIFGGQQRGSSERRRGKTSRRPRNVEVPVEVTLEEVLAGTTRTVAVGDGASRRVEVRIPPGIRDGARVRAAGEGATASGGQRGDLFLQVRVLAHPRLERQGDDLQTSITVPLTTAVLGGEVEVPTLEGPVGIKVPPDSRVGRMFRLRGRGLPRLEAPGERGDLLAVLGVDLPRALTAKERELFEELKRLGR